MEPHGFTPQCPRENGDKTWGTIAPVVPTLLSFGAASRCLISIPIHRDGFLEIGINAFIYPLEKEKTQIKGQI
jgi:hypothetical protein